MPSVAIHSVEILETQSFGRWPWAAAIYDDGRVQVWHGQYANNYSVFVKFSYQAAGKTYRGWYWKLLSGYGDAGAEKLLRSLREGPLYVRYHPSKPKVYVCDPFRDVRP